MDDAHEVVFESDIPLPSIRSITGKGKLVNHATGYFSVGYLVDIDLASLDKGALPQKYKQHPRVIPSMRGGCNRANMV